jgi:hypothetical protein
MQQQHSFSVCPWGAFFFALSIAFACGWF